MTTYLCNDCGEHLDTESSALDHESHHHDGAQTCWPTVTFETNFGFAGELVAALKEATAPHRSSWSAPTWGVHARRGASLARQHDA
jgi:hypothetical protein